MNPAMHTHVIHRSNGIFARRVQMGSYITSNPLTRLQHAGKFLPQVYAP